MRADFRIRVLDITLQMPDFGFPVSDITLQAPDSGFRVSDITLQVPGIGFRISDIGLRRWDVGHRISKAGIQARGIGFWLGGLILLLAAGSVAAAPPPSTDDQLRDSLNSKAGDDYDRELMGSPAKSDTAGRVDDEMQKRLQKELGPAAQREDKPKDPLLQIARAMREVPLRLDQRDSGAVTQHLQGQIAADLGKLIEEAKRSACLSMSPQGRKPTGNGEKQPGPNPGQVGGKPPAAVEKSDPKFRNPENHAETVKKAVALMKGLFQAELQAREREHVLEEPSEYFLPGYELEIEDYFRRLSQDHPELMKP
jgi:hypothetical protein